MQNFCLCRTFLILALLASGFRTNQSIAATEGTREVRALPAAEPAERDTRGLMPMLEGEIDRPLRYWPDASAFVITNGTEYFNRPLYANNAPFRIDAGDRPEFSFYVPGRGGNLRLGLHSAGGSEWLDRAPEIAARYEPGSMVYITRGAGAINSETEVTVLPLANDRGLIARVHARNVPDNAEFILAFGGANGMRGRRGGDIGCEVDPVSEFFQLRPEQCAEDRIETGQGTFLVRGRGATMAGILPGATIAKADAHRWPGSLDAFLSSADGSTSSTNVVVGRRSVARGETFYFLIRQTETNAQLSSIPKLSEAELERAFNAAQEKRRSVARRVIVETPDEFINAAVASLNVAADGIWDERQRSFMHGAVAWRNRLLGWRGMYTGDALGWHDRTRDHFEGFSRQQNTNPIPERIPEPEASANLSRNETALHSNGNMTRNHYDMNLVAVDAFFRHLLWTGDLDFAERMWPVIERHLAWERRLFRREFGSDKLPLYEAYAAIWASDDLGYNGGGAAHSSAYNYFHNRMAARVAKLLGRDATQYEAEADLIGRGMKRELWLPDRGWFGEWKDLLGLQAVHPTAAAWTFYHTIDSQVPTPLEAWQMTRFVDTQIVRIPVQGENVPTGGVTMPLSNWMPYTWSLNNVVLAEAAHTALAYWQAGRPEAAFPLFKGVILDSMYLGLCPGNVGMASWYDAYRRESQRDFADGVGSLSRALIEGLFGVQPDVLSGELVVQPGFPTDWNHATLQHPDLTVSFQRQNNRDTYVIESRFSRPMTLTLRIPAQRDTLASVTLNGQLHASRVMRDAVGEPRIEITAAPGARQSIVIEWSGQHPAEPVYASSHAALGSEFQAECSARVLEIADPQGVLENAVADGTSVRGIVRGQTGHRTLFARVQHGQLEWWQPLTLDVRKPFELVPIETQTSGQLSFRLRNNTSSALTGAIEIQTAFGSRHQNVNVPADFESGEIQLSSERILPGANRVTIRAGDRTLVTGDIVNWHVDGGTLTRPSATLSHPMGEGKGEGLVRFEMIDLASHFNDRVTQIFRNEYLEPRSPYCSLAVPKQGIGTWCHPTTTFDVDDSGLRLMSARNGGRIFVQGVPLATPPEPGAKNILFTSQWTNYPAEATVPLSGKAFSAYLLLAGSTAAMQSRFDNGEVLVTYADGVTERLALHNPTTWWPIDQDYFIDDYAFRRPEPIPPRVDLKTGHVRVNTLSEFKGKGGTVPGGAATVLNLTLDPDRELKSLTLRTLANEVVTGLMSVTLARQADASESAHVISPERMQAIYDEVKTPFKYALVLEPPPGKKIDCPNVFRHGNKWYMMYMQLENDPQGYTTQLASSDDLLKWTPLGTILPRGATNSWDQANAGGGVALFDPEWGGSNGLQKHDGRYWLGVVYHFYCAVGGKEQHRAIALATSKDLRGR